MNRAARFIVARASRLSSLLPVSSPSEKKEPEALAHALVSAAPETAASRARRDVIAENPIVVSVPFHPHRAGANGAGVSMCFRIFPAGVRGNSSTKLTWRGVL
jgi:hypothetical protein